MELYRRHSPTCKHKDKGYAFTKCQCPIWVDARAEIGIRKSLKTRNWEQAIRKLDRIADKKPDAETIAGALTLFLDDCRARHLAGSTILRYRNMLNPFSDYMRADAVVAEITPKNLSAYRNQRKVSANTQVKELECLKSFFWFCVNHGWLPVNPAKHLKPPVPDAPPTLPYERDEITALLDACGRIENWYTETLGRARLRAKALVLLLLYSGFRISDAVQLERSRVESGGKLLVRMMKTGNPLYVRIPQACVDALDSIPIESKYFFWSGAAKLSTAVGSARRTIDCLGRMTGINAHPHRFRDTFAVNLLLNGVDIRTVSLLLGHKSIRTTEKHYSPFVIGFQRMLDDAVGTLNFEG